MAEPTPSRPGDVAVSSSTHQITCQGYPASLPSSSFPSAPTQEQQLQEQQHEQEQQNLQHRQQQQGQEGLTFSPMENEFHAEIVNHKPPPSPPSSFACPGESRPTPIPSDLSSSQAESSESSSPSSFPSSSDTEPAASIERQASLPSAPESPETPLLSIPSPSSAHAIHTSPAPEASEILSPPHSSHVALEADPPSPILPPSPSTASTPIDHINLFNPALPGGHSSLNPSDAEQTMPFVHNVSQSLGSEPPLEWATWPAGREPALNVDINPDSEASMSSTVSDASSIASSTVASDAAGSSGQEDLDGDPAFDARKQHPGRRASYEHPHEHHRHHHRQHQPGHEDAPSAYDADEDFSGSDYSTSSCESCSRRYSPSRGNSAEFSDGQHREAPYLKQPPPPQQKRQNRSTTHQAQYHWQAPKASRPSSPDSASKPTTSTNSKPTSSLGSLPSPSQASKMVLEFVLVGALMFTIVSAAFTFSYVVTATNHAGQKLREAIEARERSVQRALERVAGEDFVKVRRQQQQRQHHYHHGTTQKQPGVVEDDRLSPAEWQELIHAAVYGLLSKWAGQGVAR